MTDISCRVLDQIQTGEPDLYSHYCSVFGIDKFNQILVSLSNPTCYSCLVNKYSNISRSFEILNAIPNVEQVEGINNSICLCLRNLEEALPPGQFPFPEPEKDENNIKLYYCLDAASVLVTEALEIHPDDDVLDMCAAPGGKSLAIIQQFTWNKGNRLGSIQLNEPNESRRKRLRIVMDDYIPQRFVSDHIRFTGSDASNYGVFDEESFDKILVDAPCSSERHLIQNCPNSDSKWTVSKSKSLARKQVQMLLNALRAVRSGGRVVYATCSLSEFENDGVVERALQKTKVDVKVTRKKWSFGGQPTKYGWLILPSHSSTESLQWGPIYFAVFVRS